MGLDAAAEKQLIDAFRNGNRQAGNALVRAHTPFVRSTARKYMRYATFDDLVSEGYVGIAKALKSFDGRGRFLTYAKWWIVAYMLDHVVRTWSIVSTGLATKTFFKHRRLRDVDLSELDPVLRVHVQRVTARDTYIGVPVIDDNAALFVIDKTHWHDPRDTDAPRGDVDVMGALALLDPRERYIVEQRMLADPEDELTLAEIGRCLGISRERARQLETRAKEKLRAPLEARA